MIPQHPTEHSSQEKVLWHALQSCSVPTPFDPQHSAEMHSLNLHWTEQQYSHPAHSALHQSQDPTCPFQFVCRSQQRRLRLLHSTQQVHLAQQQVPLPVPLQAPCSEHPLAQKVLQSMHRREHFQPRALPAMTIPNATKPR